MTDVIALGPFSIYVPHLLSIMAMLLTALFGMTIVKKHRLLDYKKAFNLIVDYWIILLVTWKVSYFLYYPEALLQNPLSVIYFNGGELGIALGVLSVVVYIYYQHQKHQIKWFNQSLLALSAVILFCGISKLIDFIYIPTLLNLLEGLSYLGLIYFLLITKSFQTFYTQMSLLRWLLIVWVIFRVFNDAIQLYFSWLLLALIVASVTIVLESIFSRKE
ncbi:hypothetical protein SAMN05216498_2547 [Tenuibacillus multivorans]|uniref:Prolipoprotein diacylglyceryltransferase n=1 Tax=Tenuibacillus multivorans TaxID=237069 RepID=A0A1H0CI90_9BACI|nr:hypothetical protein [Tenuibacillus multivorans]SDN57543.1 hypothetical protein SAMN05216498_2547 [Tenuibacillus multivorans]